MSLYKYNKGGYFLSISHNRIDIKEHHHGKIFNKLMKYFYQEKPKNKPDQNKTKNINKHNPTPTHASLELPKISDNKHMQNSNILEHLGILQDKGKLFYLEKFKIISRNSNGGKN